MTALQLPIRETQWEPPEVLALRRFVADEKLRQYATRQGTPPSLVLSKIGGTEDDILRLNERIDWNKVAQGTLASRGPMQCKIFWEQHFPEYHTFPPSSRSSRSDLHQRAPQSAAEIAAEYRREREVAHDKGPLQNQMAGQDQSVIRHSQAGREMGHGGLESPSTMGGPIPVARQAHVSRRESYDDASYGSGDRRISHHGTAAPSFEVGYQGSQGSKESLRRRAQSDALAMGRIRGRQSYTCLPDLAHQAQSRSQPHSQRQRSRLGAMQDTSSTPTSSLYEHAEHSGEVEQSERINTLMRRIERDQSRINMLEQRLLQLERQLHEQEEQQRKESENLKTTLQNLETQFWKLKKSQSSAFPTAHPSVVMVREGEEPPSPSAAQIQSFRQSHGNKGPGVNYIAIPATSMHRRRDR